MEYKFVLNTGEVIKLDNRNQFNKVLELWFSNVNKTIKINETRFKLSNILRYQVIDKYKPKTKIKTMDELKSYITRQSWYKTAKIKSKNNTKR